MRLQYPFMFALALAVGLAQNHQPDGSLAKAIEGALYGFEASMPGVYETSNPAQGLQLEFNARSTRLHHARANLVFRLAGYGYASNWNAAPPASPLHRGERVEYARGPLTEWFVNKADGLEQGFTLARRPDGHGQGEPLMIALAVEGDLKPAAALDRDSVLLQRNGETILRYEGLRSWDAHGHSIPGHLEVRDQEIRLVVDDRDAVYPLVVDPTWVQQAKLLPSDPALADRFGISVAVSGNTAVVGALNKSFGRGAAYVFVRSAGVWTQQAKLTASDAALGDLFGVSVAVDGDTAIIGADSKGFSRGAAYVFTRSGTAWTQQAKLTASDAAIGDLFGVSVSISGNTALIGADGKDSSRGAAYVFTRTAGTWTQQAKLTASDGALGDLMGVSVSVNGDTALVGADSKALLQGAAYVFVRSGTVWSEQAKLTATGGAAGDLFGVSVSLSGDTALIGADTKGGQGAAYVFTRSGTTWTQQATLTASDAALGDLFGVSVSVDGNLAVVGASLKNFTQGAAYVFGRSGTVWSEQAKLTASDGAAADDFGVSVAISGATAVVGADAKSASRGAAYVFAVQPQVINVTSTTANGTYTTGASILITVQFDGPVVVAGTPTLALNSGGTAAYTSGSGTDTLVFTYLVAPLQTTPDLDYTSTSALSLNGGSINNSADVAAVLTLPLPGAAGSLGSNKNIVIANTGPMVSQNPQNQAVCAGTLATFIAAATGIPVPTVQWQVSTDGGATYNNIPFTTTTLSFVASAAMNGNRYRAVFSNANASGIPTTGATLTVNSAPIVTSISGNANVSLGQTVIFTSSATGTPTPTVQWQVSPDGIAWTNIPGANSTTLSFVATAGVIGNHYNAVFTNSCGVASADPVVLTLAVPAAYRVSYAANLNTADSYVNLTNVGTLNGNDPAGRICINVYVFDPNEEPVSCCSCMVTPNGLKTLSVRNDLMVNPLTLSRPNAVVIKLLASAPVGGSCDPSTPAEGNLVHGLAAWRTTMHASTATSPASWQVSEVPFTPVDLNSSELTKMTRICSFIQTYASGYGLCGACKAGAQGGAQAP